MTERPLATVEVASALVSKINWGEAIKITAMLLATQGVNLPDDVQKDVLMAIIGFGGVYTWIARTFYTRTVTPSSVASTPANVPPVALKVLLGAAVLTSLLFGGDRALASDVAGKAIASALTTGYPTKCGVYYGVGTGGNAGAVNGANVGTQIVQGDLDMLIGYTCPFAQNAFWFAEGSFGFSNLNGSANGLALSGPLFGIERVGVGSPIQQYLSSILPNANFPAFPSTPSFSGATPSTAPQSYGFAGLVEQDIGAQIGALSGHQVVVAPIIGIGLLTRYSNNMMVDTWAGWQMNSNSFCPGGGSACAKLGNMARVGLSLKY